MDLVREALSCDTTGAACGMKEAERLVLHFMFKLQTRDMDMENSNARYCSMKKE